MLTKEGGESSFQDLLDSHFQIEVKSELESSFTLKIINKSFGTCWFVDVTRKKAPDSFDETKIPIFFDCTSASHYSTAMDIILNCEQFCSLISPGTNQLIANHGKNATFKFVCAEGRFRSPLILAFSFHNYAKIVWAGEELINSDSKIEGRRYVPFHNDFCKIVGLLFGKLKKRDLKQLGRISQDLDLIFATGTQNCSQTTVTKQEDSGKTEACLKFNSKGGVLNLMIIQHQQQKKPQNSLAKKLRESKVQCELVSSSHGAVMLHLFF